MKVQPTYEASGRSEYVSSLAGGSTSFKISSQPEAARGMGDFYGKATKNFEKPPAIVEEENKYSSQQLSTSMLMKVSILNRAKSANEPAE